MKAFLVAILVIALIGGGYAVFRNKPETKVPNNTAANTSTATDTNQTTVAATITYSNDGFSPAITTVKAGDTIAIKNTSSKATQLDSNPHPVHTDDPDLNVGVVNPGQTKTFTVTKKGTYGLHNHLSPGDEAKITVE